MTADVPLPPPTQRLRSGFVLVATAYLAFVVYGSLVPLAYRPLPLEAAWEAFRDIRYLRLGIGSRADWVANVLLFVPLAFLWLGVWWPARGRLGQALASVAVLACCAALCVGIEFTQIFFPPRTVSLNDILAECIGAVIGVVAWWLAGRRVERWFAGWARTHTAAGTAARLLVGYLFLLFGYNVLPLDLTISPVELFHKWREGKVVLIPFTAPFPSAAQRIYDLLTDAAIWAPAAFLWRSAAPHSMGSVLVRVLGAAAALELLQLFVYSRVTDVTDIVTAGLGGAAGAWLAGRAGRPAHAPTTSEGSPWAGAFAWSAGLIVILGLLCAVFWYPFDFRTDWSFVRARVLELKRVPLAAYYYGTEFRAVTELLHKVGFFLPLGAWLALGAAALHRRERLPKLLVHAIAVAMIAGVSAGIVAGRIFLPTKYPDLADWIFQTAGGLGGYFGLWWLRVGSHHAETRARSSSRTRRSRVEMDKGLPRA